MQDSLVKYMEMVHSLYRVTDAKSGFGVYDNLT